jgi:hypothetical protein
MEGLAEIVLILVQIAVVISATGLLFAWDERRMTEAQRARAWPPATRAMVIGSPLWFPLWIVGVPLHFVRTRRNLRGALEAILWTFVLFALLFGAAFAVSFAFDGEIGAD